MSVTVVWTAQPHRLHEIALAAVADVTGARRESLRFLHVCGRCGSSEHGQPFVTGAPGVQVSLSRSGDLGVVAIALGHPVGVDVETATPDIGDPGRWVRTEAVLKLIGTGLTVDSASVDFRLTSSGSHVLRRWPAGLQRPDCGVIDLDAWPDHIAALALAPGQPVVSRRWEVWGA